MDLAMLADLSKWMEQTDLEEITLRKGKDRIMLKAGNEIDDSANIPVMPLKSISSPSIGLFRFAMPGRSRILSTGDKINRGDKLGWIETGQTREAVISQYTVNIKVIAIKDGQPAEYGQPLFFIETE